jgi:hypothetical protein
MSNALAIASVTAVLKGILQNATTDTKHNINMKVSQVVNVTAISPSRIAKPDGEEVPQLNLFLYQIAPNGALRNLGLPSRSQRGERLTNPPLALDLYYLLTAYGKLDFEAEIILGYAMQVFHEMPILSREIIRNILHQPSGDSKPSNALKDSDLADQIELIKLTALSMNAEETSKLWTAIGTGYRPSVAYQASLILIEGSSPLKQSLPVLTIGKDDSGIISRTDAIVPHANFPALTEAKPPGGQISVMLGDTLTIMGYNLDAADATVFFRSRLSDKPFKISALPYANQDTLRIILPKEPYLEDPARPETRIDPDEDWPAGFYQLWMTFGSETNKKTTNNLVISLAPHITGITKNANSVEDNKIVDVAFKPGLHQGQRASLLLGSIEILPEDYDMSASSVSILTFRLGSIPSGKYIAWLRVDGIDSPFVDRSCKPPRFLPAAEVNIT